MWGKHDNGSMTGQDVLELLPNETFESFFNRVGKVLVKKPTVDPRLMTSRSLLTLALSYNNLVNKRNVPLEKATLLKWIREVGWAGSGISAADLTDEELDQRLKYAYTYRLAGKPPGLVDTATTIKYATGRGSYCLECFTGFERNRRCGHSELPVLNICGVDTCGVAYHTCCLNDPSSADLPHRRGTARATWYCEEHAKTAMEKEKEPDKRVSVPEGPALAIAVPGPAPYPREGPTTPRYGYGAAPAASAPVPVPDSRGMRPSHPYSSHETGNSRSYYSPVKAEPRSMPSTYPPLPYGAREPEWKREQPKRQRVDRERAYSWSEPNWAHEEPGYGGASDTRLSSRYSSWGDAVPSAGGGSERSSGEWTPSWDVQGPHSHNSRYPPEKPGASSSSNDGGQCLFMLAEMAAQREKMRCTPFDERGFGHHHGHGPAYSPPNYVSTGGPYAATHPRASADSASSAASPPRASVGREASMVDGIVPASAPGPPGPPGPPLPPADSAVHIVDPNSYNALTQALEGMYGHPQPYTQPESSSRPYPGYGSPSNHTARDRDSSDAHAERQSHSHGQDPGQDADSMAKLSQDLRVVTVTPVEVDPVS